MEKRALIAIVASALILFIWFKLFPPPEPPARPVPDQAVATEELREPAPEETADETYAERAGEATDEAPPVDRIEAAAEERIVIEGPLYRAELTNDGARLISWQLLEYTTPNGEPLELLPHYVEGEPTYLELAMDDELLAEELQDALYRVERETLHGDGEQGAGERITFTWSDGRDLSARKVLEFRHDEYIVGVEAEVTYRGRRRPVRVALGPGFAAQETSEGRSNYYYASQLVWNRSGEVSREKRKSVSEDGALSGNFVWAGLEDQYFAALVIPQGGGDRVAWGATELTSLLLPNDDPDEEIEARGEPTVTVSVPEEGALLYLGPKKYTQLRELGMDLDKVVWFSSYGWLRPIVKYLFLALLWFHDNLAHNYGLAIVMATFVLRLLLFPVNQYSMVAMKKSQLQMQRLQPKIKAIKAKYKKKDAQSRQKINQETMDLYRKEGVNPMAGVTGCLPLLAQFPFLIGFYNMLTVAVELRGAPFVFWIQDLSREDPYWITPLVMGATMFIQQKMAMSKIKDPQQLQQQRMMLFMPIMFTVICLNMPSGLVLYWFVNNVLGIGQQWLVNRHTGRFEGSPPKPTKTPKTKKAKA